MKPKLNPIYFILGIFLFKVSVFDNLRKIGHHNNQDMVASESSKNYFKPIR